MDGRARGNAFSFFKTYVCPVKTNMGDPGKFIGEGRNEIKNQKMHKK